MKTLSKKIMLLATGLMLNFGSVGLIAPHPASAQSICQSYRVTRPAGLYVYVDGGDRIITTLPYDTIVRVVGLSRGGDWAEIRYLRVDGLTGAGWVAAAHLRCFQE